MPGMATLDGINLSTFTVWTDERAWTPHTSQVTLTMNGTMVVESISPKADGQPMTLYVKGIKTSDLNAVQALVNETTQRVLTVVLCDGRSFSVIFRHHEPPPLEHEPIVQVPDESIGPDYHVLTIKLMIHDLGA
jgi:hypothetical protein